MRLFIFMSLISFNVFAEGLASFETYKANFPLLQKDITRMEALVQKNDSPQYVEMLKNMTSFKENYDHLSNTLSLQAFNDDAKTNRWANLVKMSQELMASCESANASAEACKAGLEKMKAFTLASNLSALNKESVTTFIDDYVLQVDAFALINSEFIANFNKNSEAINLKIKEVQEKSRPDQTRPISVQAAPAVKERVIHMPKNPVLVMEESSPFFSFGKEALYAVMALLAFCGIGYVAYKNFKQKQMVKMFYSKLFTLAKKNNVHLKIFGSITPREAKMVETIQHSFLNAVYLSRSVSNKAQIKFKNRGKNLAVEVNYVTSRSIQNIITLPKETSFKESVEELQSVIEENGGEFMFTNHFNSLGELIQSSMLFSLPKQ
jgi:hypothetical protein